MSEREHRLATNEAYFRDVNERVEEEVKDIAGEYAVFNILCECASITCAERMAVTASEYADAHKDPRQFMVAIGHAQPDIEDSVMRTDSYELVRKRGEAGETAAKAARP